MAPAVRRSWSRRQLRRLETVFGPLNGVRTALVIAAGIAAVAAAVLGEWVMAGLLGAGVALHGVGWWYLWKHQPPADQR